MKLFFFLVLVSGLSPVIAQIDIDRNERYLLDQKNPAQDRNDSVKTLLNLNGAYFFNSNSINNNFIRFFRNNFITDKNKTENEKRLRKVNRVGLEMNAGITWMQKTEKITYVLGLNERRLFNAKFGEDFFKIIFRGNGAYVGKHAQLSPLKLTYFNYESLYLGVQKNSGGEKLMMGGGISLIRGGAFDQAKIKKGTLYTDSSLAYLDFNMDYQLAYSDNQNSAFAQTSGLGVASTFYLTWTMKKGQLNFEMKDLGFINYKKLNVYSGDSTYRYDGYHVNDVFQFNDSIFSNLKADSVAKEMGLRKERKSLTYFIPATLHVNYTYNHSDRLTMVTGVKHMLNAAYIPRLYIKMVYYLKKNLIIVPTLAYGGFGRGDFELGIAKSFKDKLMISANLFYLEYFLLPKKSSGNGFNLSLTALF